MINFNNVEIERVIMHRVSARSGNNAPEVTPSDRLLNLDSDAIQIIKDRLVSAFGRQSKSFELAIEKDEDGTCFSLINSLRYTEDDAFIEITVNIAYLLAASQMQPKISGGYLLVIQCKFNNKPIYVLIKAEPHNALGVSEMNVQSFKNIILSPEQKLYKAAYFEQIDEIDETVQLTKDNYRAFLFDSNVNSSKSIAQYFYKDFLGLTISGNAQLETSLFYTMMEDLIRRYFKGKSALDTTDALRDSILSDDTTINPHEVINEIIPLEKRDDFLDIIVDRFPQSISKDISLIENKMAKKSIWLFEKVKITAETVFFDDNVSVEETEGEYIVRIRR